MKTNNWKRNSKRSGLGKWFAGFDNLIWVFGDTACSMGKTEVKKKKKKFNKIVIEDWGFFFFG